MKTFGFFKSKKYFQRVTVSIILSMTLILTGLSVANTYILERSVKRAQEDSNLKVLTQIQYNLSYMHEIIAHLSSFSLKDNYLMPLMFSEPTEMEYIRGYLKMRQLMEASSFLQDIAVYNAAERELYGSSTSFLIDGGITKSMTLEWLLHPPRPHPIMQLIPVSIAEGDSRIHAFAFIVTDAYVPFDEHRSAIVFFVDSDWVFDSLENMNGIGGEDRGDIYIRTSDGTLFFGEGRSAPEGLDHNEIASLVERDRASFGRQSGFVVGNTGQEKSMVTYMDGIGDWTILYLQPYEKLMKEVSDARATSLLISGAFLLLSVALSVWLSYKLYDPIETMLRRLRPHVMDEAEAAPAVEGTELDLMSDNVLRLSEKLQEISSEQIVNKYYLRKFLTDSPLFSHRDAQRLIERHDLRISIHEPISICVLRIDRYAAYERGASGASKKLYAFAIVNIAQEIMSRSFRSETVDMQANHIAIVVSGTSEDGAIPRLHASIRDIQTTIEQYYGISLSCGVGGPVSQFPQLSAAYHQAYQLSLYSFAFGYRSIVAPGDIRDNAANPMKYLPNEIERRLSEALKKGQLTEAGSELEKAFSLLIKFQYEDMRRAISDLAWVLQNTAADIANNRIVSLSVDMDSIHKIPNEQETLEEMYMSFLAVCAKICEGQRPASVERNEWIVETVKELIEQKFPDINLSQQTIASTVKLTSAYLGKLFKESSGVTVTEYINDVRLRHAQELLLRTDHPIAKIMEKCGYANQSYFFRLFKGKFGCTPKEFRIKRALS
ncbi:helix-turn-helix domain-containing protein [Paenibacillus sp.]|uniref:helix-turn-helix domain-containing protein n=1 Tax=Paenibacillus sp. TaxID=58172 RepID=UPI002811F6ED|nr:helix-turn-helix domain-containing protein [Paenibacillus sp.]